MGRTARTAASLCVFLTLGTSTFLAAVAVLRAAVFGAGRFVDLAATFGLAAVFRAAGLGLAALRVAGLAAEARFALGLVATDFAWAARFAVFAVVRFAAFERVGDRRKPFVRLLLMGGISKGCSTMSSRRNRPAAYHRLTSKSTNTSICGALSAKRATISDKRTNKEKHLMVSVGYVKVRLACGGQTHLGT